MMLKCNAQIAGCLVPITHHPGPRAAATARTKYSGTQRWPASSTTRSCPAV